MAERWLRWRRTPSSLVIARPGPTHSPPVCTVPRNKPSVARSAEIGKAFVTHYYQAFDASIEQRATLQGLYQNESMLTFENEQFMGMQAIMTKLTVRRRGPSSARPSATTELRRARSARQTLQFQTVQHQPTTTDCQPTRDNGIVVFVTGKLAVRQQPRAPQACHFLPHSCLSNGTAQDLCVHLTARHGGQGFGSSAPCAALLAG